jgi:hypothetical protein
VPTRGAPPIIYAMVAGGPVFIVVVALIVLRTPGWVRSIGFTAWLAVFALVLVLSAMTSLMIAGNLRPTAVRPTPDGVELRRMFGSSRTIKWGSVQAGPVMGKFRLLRDNSQPGLAVLVTTDQWLAVRSSQYRPPGDWALS